MQRLWNSILEINRSNIAPNAKNVRQVSYVFQAYILAVRADSVFQQCDSTKLICKHISYDNQMQTILSQICKAL